MKLHLGCGQSYLDGYLNVDFPPEMHSVQSKSPADVHADILSLAYPAESIEEIRLHHVFEHFSRPVACALLAGWFSWLKPCGTLRIEVPDLQKSARVLLSRFTPLKSKSVAERHLFGSHEAHWAVHFEGYTPELLAAMLTSFGYTVNKTTRTQWKGTYNFELLAKKSSLQITPAEFKDIAEGYLRNFLVDDAESEERLLQVWIHIYTAQAERSWARCE